MLLTEARLLSAPPHGDAAVNEQTLAAFHGHQARPPAQAVGFGHAALPATSVLALGA
jgi:hypothetical protein